MRCFNNNLDIPIDQYSFIMANAGLVNQAMKKDELMLDKRKKDRVQMFVRWNTPRVGWVKLNTNVVAKGNPGNVGCGGLIRGHRGEIYDVFAANYGVCSCTKAELLGVLRGLVVA